MHFETSGGALSIDIERTVVAGWTGRNAAAVQHHIAELAEIGVAPPSQVPLYYRVASSLLTQAPEIQVVGDGSSGEAEPLVIRAAGKTWLGLASDHTDRELESVSVAASKQICAKPVAKHLWAFEEVEDHLDEIELRCEIEEDGVWVLYQHGTLADIRPLPELIDGARLAENYAMLCGTLAAIGGVRPALSYRMTLSDPVRERQIALAYTVATLPVIS